MVRIVPENVTLSRKTGANQSDVVQIRKLYLEGLDVQAIADTLRLENPTVQSFVDRDFGEPSEPEPERELTPQEKRAATLARKKAEREALLG